LKAWYALLFLQSLRICKTLFASASWIVDFSSPFKTYRVGKRWRAIALLVNTASRACLAHTSDFKLTTLTVRKLFPFRTKPAANTAPATASAGSTASSAMANLPAEIEAANCAKRSRNYKLVKQSIELKG
jgi:hypothetical protein